MGTEQENLASPEGITAGVIMATPALTAKQFEGMTEGQEAVVLISFATGTAPGRLAPVIQKRTEEGVPIFLLSNNPGDKHGIRRTVYMAQEVVEKAGAIPLRTVNVNNLDEVTEAIREESLTGLRGAELGQAIYQRFDLEKGNGAAPAHGN